MGLCLRQTNYQATSAHLVRDACPRPVSPVFLEQAFSEIPASSHYLLPPGFLGTQSNSRDLSSSVNSPLTQTTASYVDPAGPARLGSHIVSHCNVCSALLPATASLCRRPEFISRHLPFSICLLLCVWVTFATRPQLTTSYTSVAASEPPISCLLCLFSLAFVFTQHCVFYLLLYLECKLHKGVVHFVCYVLSSYKAMLGI